MIEEIKEGFDRVFREIDMFIDKIYDHIYTFFRMWYMILRHGLDETDKMNKKELEELTEKRNSLWHKRYKEYMMLRAGLSETEAEDALQAGMGEYDYEDDPEDAAEMEMSYWGES